MCESTGTELILGDLEKLPCRELARICEWLVGKLDGLSSRTRAEPKDAEEKVPLFWLGSFNPYLVIASVLHGKDLQCAIVSEMWGSVYMQSPPCVISCMINF